MFELALEKIQRPLSNEIECNKTLVTILKMAAPNSDSILSKLGIVEMKIIRKIRINSY